MKRIELTLFALLLCAVAFAQAPADRSYVRKGNRAYNLGELDKAEDLYNKALGRDSNSVAANYNLANTFYKQEKYEEAEKLIDKAEAAAVADPSIVADDIYFTKGNLALQQKNYSTAVDAFKQVLKRNPNDMDARESYIYAKKMLEDQQNNPDQNQQNQNQDQNQQNQDQNQDQNQQNQDQNQDQNKDQNKDQQQQQNQDQNQDQNQQDRNKDQNQDQNQDQQDQQQQQAPAEGQLSKEAMEQMLRANEAKEKQTQEKVKEMEAMRMKSRQKEKNW